jgi:6-phosphogluconolactonase (cycloisomerase 2 family)
MACANCQGNPIPGNPSGAPVTRYLYGLDWRNGTMTLFGRYSSSGPLRPFGTFEGPHSKTLETNPADMDRSELVSAPAEGILFQTGFEGGVTTTYVLRPDIASGVLRIVQTLPAAAVAARRAGGFYVGVDRELRFCSFDAATDAVITKAAVTLGPIQQLLLDRAERFLLVIRTDGSISYLRLDSVGFPAHAWSHRLPGFYREGRAVLTPDGHYAYFLVKTRPNRLLPHIEGLRIEASDATELGELAEVHYPNRNYPFTVSPKGSVLHFMSSPPVSYAVDPATGKLTPRRPGLEQVGQEIAFLTSDPDGEVAYAFDRATSRLHVLASHDDGRLESLGSQIASMEMGQLGFAKADHAPRLWPKYGFVTNKQSWLLAFKVDPISGEMSLADQIRVVDFRSQPAVPGAVAADPLGRFVALTSPTQGEIISYRVDSSTGKLTQAGIVSAGAGTLGPLATDLSGRFVYAGGTAGVYHLAANVETGVLARKTERGGPVSFISIHPIDDALVLSSKSNVACLLPKGPWDGALTSTCPTASPVLVPVPLARFDELGTQVCKINQSSNTTSVVLTEYAAATSLPPAVPPVIPTRTRQLSLSGSYAVGGAGATSCALDAATGAVYWNNQPSSIGFAIYGPAFKLAAQQRGTLDLTTCPASDGTTYTASSVDDIVYMQGTGLLHVVDATGGAVIAVQLGPDGRPTGCRLATRAVGIISLAFSHLRF